MQSRKSIEIICARVNIYVCVCLCKRKKDIRENYSSQIFFTNKRIGNLSLLLGVSAVLLCVA